MLQGNPDEDENERKKWELEEEAPKMEICPLNALSPPTDYFQRK